MGELFDIRAKSAFRKQQQKNNINALSYYSYYKHTCNSFRAKPVPCLAEPNQRETRLVRRVIRHKDVCHKRQRFTNTLNYVLLMSHQLQTQFETLYRYILVSSSGWRVGGK